MDEIDFRWYQKEAVNKFKTINKGALFMDTGVGKTFTALEIFKHEKILVIAPAPKINSKDWQKDAKEYYGKEILAYSFEKLRQRKGKRPLRDALVNKIINGEITGIIIDECHRAKSSWRSSEDSKNIYYLTSKTPRVLGLTASYAPNNYVETWYMLQNLGVNALPHIHNKEQFITAFYNYSLIPTAYGSIKKPTSLLPQAEDVLFRHFNPYIYFYMPEKMEHEIKFINIEGELPEEYKKVESGVIEDDTLSVFEKLSKLQQLANGFSYLYDYVEKNGQVVKKINNYVIYDKLKIQKLKEILLGNPNDDIIVVYKYQADKDLIEELIKELNVDIILRQANQSEGVNLQANNHIIFYSPTFSHKDFEQMKGRIMRIGQKRLPKFTLLCRKNTVEEYIYQVIKNKGKSSDLLRIYMEAR